MFSNYFSQVTCEVTHGKEYNFYINENKEKRKKEHKGRRGGGDKDKGGVRGER